MELVDTHCHLDAAPLGADVDGALARAAASDVRRVIVPAYDRDSWRTVPVLGARPGVAVALGLHPWAVAQGFADDDLVAGLQASRAVAVGEIGLDYKIDGADRALQRDALSRQLAIARDLDLPVILHCRQAADDLLALLAPHAPALRGVIHAFSRGPELAARFVTLGLHVAFGGAVTQPRAERAQRAARCVPAERLLVETDAPCIALRGIPAEQAEPAHARLVAQALAELRGAPLAAIAERTTENARALFHLA